MLGTLQVLRLAVPVSKQSSHNVIRLPGSIISRHLSARPFSLACQCSIARLQKAFPASRRTFATRATGAKTTKSTNAGRPKAKSSTRTRPTRKVAAGKSAKSSSTTRKPARSKARAGAKRTGRRARTEKQKQALVARKRRDHLKELKEKALFGLEPKQKPAAAWTVFVQQRVAKHANVRETMKQAAAEFKALSPSELEAYNHTASQNRLENEHAYRAWVESNTPEAIRQANIARQALVRAATKDGRPAKKGRGYQTIKDERQVKRPMPAYFHFNREKQTNGDLHGMAIADRARLVKQDWASLSPAQKKPYEDLAAADLSRYYREFKTIYGHDSPSAHA